MPQYTPLENEFYFDEETRTAYRRVTIAGVTHWRMNSATGAGMPGGIEIEEYEYETFVAPLRAAAQAKAKGADNAAE